MLISCDQFFYFNSNSLIQVIDEADRLMMDDLRDDFFLRIERAICDIDRSSKTAHHPPYGNTYEQRNLLSSTNIIRFVNIHTIHIYILVWA